MIDGTSYFHERQTFATWVIVVVVLAMFGPLPFAFFFDPKGNSSLAVLIIPVVFALLIGFIGYMDTDVRQDGIHVRFGFFRFIHYDYVWDDIEHFEARTYKPIAEYGGWGIKGFDNKLALNMKGNRGVDLTLRNSRSDRKRTVMIGSQHAEALEAAIGSAMAARRP